jgi:hypothetical protein
MFVWNRFVVPEKLTGVVFCAIVLLKVFASFRPTSTARYTQRDTSVRKLKRVSALACSVTEEEGEMVRTIQSIVNKATPIDSVSRTVF